MKTIKQFALIGSIALMFAGCAGKDGAPGATGPTGADGAPGANGNANVTSSIISVPTSSWTINGTYPTEIDYAATFSGTLPAGTDVQAFSSADNTNWTALPWVSTGNGPYFELAYTYASTGMTFSWYNITQGSSAAPAPFSPTYFNIVIITPAAMKQHPGTNWKDYNQVKAILAAQATASK